MKYLLINIEKFLNDQESKLFIIGAPGSGKTTLSRIIGKELQLEIFSTDSIGALLENTDKVEYKNHYRKSLEGLTYKKGKAIIEGVGIMRLDSSWVSQQPLIIILKPFWPSVMGFIKDKRQSSYPYLYLIYHGVRLNLKWQNRLKNFTKEFNVSHKISEHKKILEFLNFTTSAPKAS